MLSSRDASVLQVAAQVKLQLLETLINMTVRDGQQSDGSQVASTSGDEVRVEAAGQCAGKHDAWTCMPVCCMANCQFTD